MSEEMNEELKQGMAGQNIQKLLEQLSGGARTPEQRKQIEMLKQMAPLYEKHEFWDTQPMIKDNMRGAF